MAVILNEKVIGTKCAKCHHGIMGETDNSCEWFSKCDDCGHLVFCYEPMPHQLRFHLDNSKFKMYGGGRNSVASSLKTSVKFGETLRNVNIL